MFGTKKKLARIEKIAERQDEMIDYIKNRLGFLEKKLQQRTVLHESYLTLPLPSEDKMQVHDQGVLNVKDAVNALLVYLDVSLKHHKGTPDKFVAEKNEKS